MCITARLIAEGRTEMGLCVQSMHPFVAAFWSEDDRGGMSTRLQVLPGLHGQAVALMAQLVFRLLVLYATRC
jgi:hypothetical protein